MSGRKGIEKRGWGKKADRQENRARGKGVPCIREVEQGWMVG